MTATLAAGPNLALKVPMPQFEDTVRFYRDVAGMPLLHELAPDVVFAFGANRLWVDPVEDLERAELWLQLTAPDTAAAAVRLREAGVDRCDTVEALPEGFDGFWIRNPAGVVHLVSAAARQEMPA